MLLAKNYGKYAKIHYIHMSSYILDMALNIMYISSSCMIVSCFISLFVVLHLCIQWKKKKFTHPIYYCISHAARNHMELCYTGFHPTCHVGSWGECCHKDLAKCQKSKMPTFMTQDERVVSAGLLATQCILGHCCSE